MPADFRDASERHWDDSGTCSPDTRLANADHLVGLAAECALKAVMQGLGMPLRGDGAPAERRLGNISIWCGMNSLLSRRTPEGAHYVATLSGNLNPFSDWDVNQRYSHRIDFNEANVRNHRLAAEESCRFFKQLY